MAERDQNFTDFDSAEEFLRIAKNAHQAGNKVDFLAACKLLAVALGLSEFGTVNLRTGHLR